MSFLEIKNLKVHYPIRGGFFNKIIDYVYAVDGVDMVIEKGKMKIIPTGLKAYMGNDEYLSIHIRSSIAIKKGIVLMNSTGIIDADYYNNPENEGHIMIALYNTSETDFSVTKGERIAQGIFQKYLKIENDNSESTRKGGFGSTGK